MTDWMKASELSVIRVAQFGVFNLSVYPAQRLGFHHFNLSSFPISCLESSIGAYPNGYPSRDEAQRAAKVTVARWSELYIENTNNGYALSASDLITLIARIELGQKQSALLLRLIEIADGQTFNHLCWILPLINTLHQQSSYPDNRAQWARQALSALCEIHGERI